MPGSYITQVNTPASQSVVTPATLGTLGDNDEALADALSADNGWVSNAAPHRHSGLSFVPDGFWCYTLQESGLARTKVRVPAMTLVINGIARTNGLALTLDVTTTGANGLDTGPVAANGKYYLYAITKNPGAYSDTNWGGFRLIASTNSSSPNLSGLPENASLLISAFLTDGSSKLRPYVQEGFWVRFADAMEAANWYRLLNGGTQTVTFADVSADGKVPDTCRLVRIVGKVRDVGNNECALVVREKDQGDPANLGAVSIAAGRAIAGAVNESASPEMGMFGAETVVGLDGSRVFQYQLSGSAGNGSIWIVGFKVM